MYAKHLARHLRRNLSPIEWILWRRLRSRQIHNRKFRRQHPIGPYVVDFFCDEERMIIELDGPTHGFPDQMRKDPIRQHYLERLGFTVLRYTNEQVLTALDFVLEDVARHFTVAPHPTPLPRGEGD